MGASGIGEGALGKRQSSDSESRIEIQSVANMSHEIRTPLGAILGFTELLQEDELSQDERKEFIEVIQRNGAALSRLLDDILDIAKVEADMLTVESIPLSPRGLVNEIVTAFHPRLRARPLTIQTIVDPEVPQTIQSDPTRLRQILTNVLGNAVKFTEAGTISVHLQYSINPQPTIIFRIKDPGIGIPVDQQRSLFQPFHQADGSTTRRFGGTGLGLSLSRLLAHALNGDVVLERSTPGQGSVFVVSICLEK